MRPRTAWASRSTPGCTPTSPHSRQRSRQTWRWWAAFPPTTPFWRFQTVYGLLWPRGYLVRAQGLSFYNPFADAPLPDRDLLLDLLRAGEPTVALAPGWEAAVAQVLTDRGAVCLTAAPADRTALKEALLRLAAEPVEVNFLHLHPNAVGVAHDPAQIAVTLDLREVMP